LERRPASVVDDDSATTKSNANQGDTCKKGASVMTSSRMQIAATEAFKTEASGGNVSKDEAPTPAPASTVAATDERGTRHLPPSVDHPKPRDEPLKNQF
jgi:hypothetical protein